MKSLAMTIATIWRLSVPYFRSEDRWPGRILLASVIAIELSLVAIQVILNQRYNRFYNTLQDHNWNAFVSAILFFCEIAAVAEIPCGLPALPQSMAANPLAALDDADDLRQMAGFRQPLPHAASRRRCRQSGSTHRRRLTKFCAIHADHLHWHPQLSGYFGLVRLHLVATVGGSAAHCVRRQLQHSRLPGLGRGQPTPSSAPHSRI